MTTTIPTESNAVPAMPSPWAVQSTAPSSALRALAEVDWDVVVIGSGNAALVAALTARRLAERVLVLERAPRHMRGGNTRHTRNIRCAHATADEFTPGTYSVDELFSDLQGVGRGPVNRELARFVVAESQTIPRWMADHGVRWQQPLAGTLNLNRTNRFFLGGGTALVNHYARTAELAGVRIVYEAAVSGLQLRDDRRCTAVVLDTVDGPIGIPTAAAVVASGGFEANHAWLRRYWGDAADNYLVRGTPYNDGSMLALMVNLGAAVAGEPRGFHAIAVDARAPRFDGGIATRLDSVPYSIVVNRGGDRFADEGSDIWPKRYASWGGLIAAQDGQIAYSIYDAQAAPLFMPSMYPAYTGTSVAEVARSVGLDADRVVRTVADFNAHVDPAGRFDPKRLDGCGTRGLNPPKSNWALPIQASPFHILPLRTGITFTFMGLSVNECAQVLGFDGRPFTNVYAAGEVMSGNILSSGYLAGFGLTIGSVFGRIAGREAAMHNAH
ncbi:MAG TPA: FAD-dependent tricarballylate dehydrogenase TcuA [Candidatus Dormibacteraeota bacterium]|jgi:tricarballylate dehydrogenase